MRYARSLSFAQIDGDRKPGLSKMCLHDLFRDLLNFLSNAE